jgi:hypothetical protein
MYNCERKMITISDVGEMVAHFKKLTKEFPKGPSKIKREIIRLSFLVKDEKRDTGTQNELFGIFSSGASRTSE